MVGAAEATRLVLGALSEIFQPFLDRFVGEAVQGRGEVWVSEEKETVNGLLLFNQVERVGSIFTSDPTVARALYGLKDNVAVFSEFPLDAKAEVYQVFAAEPPGGTAHHRFTHVVRTARADEHPAIVRMLNEMYGQIDTSWLRTAAPSGEKCFVVEVAGELAGAGWASVVRSHGRLHSLSVRPRYRRVGIGTDLWHARMLWTWRAGARQVISEISEHNVASLAIATAGGMHPVGRMFLSLRPPSGAAPASGDGRPAVRADLVRHVD
jgi:GNAT superfamily N-acetyltransferase